MVDVRPGCYDHRQMNEVDSSSAADRLRALIDGPIPVSSPAERMAATADLFEFACDIRRGKLRREHPDQSPEQIEQLIDAWLQERPGAELGDGEGRPVPWPRDHSE